MNPKSIGAALVILAIVLVIVGLLMMAVIVPGMKQFPDDVDTTRQYRSLAPMTLFAEIPDPRSEDPENPDSMFAPLTLDVILERNFKTEEVDGELALVSETQMLRLAPDAEPLPLLPNTAPGDPLPEADGEDRVVAKTYVLNRETMEHVDELPTNWNREEVNDARVSEFRRGLVLGWPIEPEEEDYTGWSDDYQDTVPMVYQGLVEDHRGTGVDTYYFTSTSAGYDETLFTDDPGGVVATTPMYTRDMDDLRKVEWAEELGFPDRLRDDEIYALMMADEESRASIEALNGGLTLIGLDTLDDYLPNIDVVYYYDYFGEYWVEVDTGVMIDTRKREIRQVALAPEARADIEEETVDFAEKVGEAYSEQVLLPWQAALISEEDMGRVLLSITRYGVTVDGVVVDGEIVVPGYDPNTCFPTFTAVSGAPDNPFVRDEVAYMCGVLRMLTPAQVRGAPKLPQMLTFMTAQAMAGDDPQTESGPTLLLDPYSTLIAGYGMAVDGFVQQINHMTVFRLEYEATDESVEDAKEDSEDAIAQFRLYGTYVPIGLIILGVLFGGGGVYFLAKNPEAEIDAPLSEETGDDA
ncbi:MAG: DUF3068 domain-containing protein [Chloroflexi bacterium]|nr:DUF3068 domain-containing protein [Chloroflexota bacterium]